MAQSGKLLEIIVGDSVSNIIVTIEWIQLKAKSFTSQVAHGAGTYLRFCSVKWMTVFDSPWTGH